MYMYNKTILNDWPEKKNGKFCLTLTFNVPYSFALQTTGGLRETKQTVFHGVSY